MDALAMKSGFVCAADASLRLEPTDVPRTDELMQNLTLYHLSKPRVIPHRDDRESQPERAFADVVVHASRDGKRGGQNSTGLPMPPDA